MVAWLVGIGMLSFVMSVTPGPNNLLFAASGARVGYLRSLPGLLGMLLGFALVIATACAGVGALLTAEPRSQRALTVLASAYMLWLAVRLWRSSGAHGAADLVGLPSWWQFAALQFANPKTWLATLGLVSGFLGAQAPGGLSVRVLGAVWFLAVVSLSATLWVLFGATLRARVGPGHWTAVNRTLAVLAAATTGVLWL